MSVFTAAEIEYLRTQTLGRLVTVGPDGRPHAVPITFYFNAEEDAVDVGGVSFGKTKKWRDARQNPKVTLLVDDVIIGPPRQARALEIRGDAEAHETGGETINPRFPSFQPEFLRIRPVRIVSWGIDEGGVDAGGFRVTSRAVR